MVPGGWRLLGVAVSGRAEMVFGLMGIKGLSAFLRPALMASNLGSRAMVSDGSHPSVTRMLESQESKSWYASVPLRRCWSKLSGGRALSQESKT